MTALERRADVLRMLRSSLDERSVFFWIGGENPQPELRSVSVIGANYGLGHRNLGAVGVVGPAADGLRDRDRLGPPRRPRALPLLRDRLQRLTDATRLLRGPRGLPGRRRDRDQEGLPRPGARAAPRRQRPRPRGGGEVQGGRRGLRGPLRRRAAPHLRRLRARGPALGRLRPRRRLRLDRRHLPGLLRRPAAASAAGAGPLPAATSRSRSRSSWPRSRPAPAARSPTTSSAPASTATATAPSRGRRSGPASAAAAPASCGR